MLLQLGLPTNDAIAKSSLKKLEHGKELAAKRLSPWPVFGGDLSRSTASASIIRFATEVVPAALHLHLWPLGFQAVKVAV